MIDDNFLISLIGITVACVAVFKLTNDNNINEGFLGNLPSFTTKLERTVGCKDGTDFYSIPGQYQSMLAPRMSGTANYGASIRYNLPAQRNMAVNACDPLSMGNMVNENYTPPQQRQVKEKYCGAGSCGTGGPPKCSKGGMGMAVPYASQNAPQLSSYTAGNFDQVASQVYANNKAYPDTQSMLPVGTMETVNGLGEVNQAVVYDRIIYANRNSRLRSLGDPIRGDIPIVPCSGGWFRPSVNPNIDLQQGAMNVIAGVNNDTAKDLANLINISSGGTTTAIGGVDLSNQFSTSTCAGSGDIIVSAYP
jgi:hypothetical protein